MTLKPSGCDKRFTNSGAKAFVVNGVGVSTVATKIPHRSDYFRGIALSTGVLFFLPAVEVRKMMPIAMNIAG